MSSICLFDMLQLSAPLTAGKRGNDDDAAVGSGRGGAAIKAASCLPLGRLNVSPIDRQMTFQWRRIRPKKEGEFHNAGDLTVDSPSLSLTEQAGRQAG